MCQVSFQCWLFYHQRSILLSLVPRIGSPWIKCPCLLQLALAVGYAHGKQMWQHSVLSKFREPLSQFRCCLLYWKIISNPPVLIPDAITSKNPNYKLLKLSSLPGKNVDVNVLKCTRKKKIKCDYLPIYFYIWQWCSHETQLLHIGFCWIIFQRKMPFTFSNDILNLWRIEAQSKREQLGGIHESLSEMPLF